jgi:hypothetical protein
MDGRAGRTTTTTAKALTMLSAFSSIGARTFNLTLTKINGEKMPGGYCAMGRNSRFTGDFRSQKFLAKVHSFARTFTMAGSEIRTSAMRGYQPWTKDHDRICGHRRI